MMHGRVDIQHASITYTRGKQIVQAVQDVTLTIHPGEFVALLGASGCGKSTLLNAVAGFLKPTQGQILVDREPVTAPGVDRGMVFQQHALFPWKTVEENVAFGLKMRGIPSYERQEQVRTFLHLVGLDGFAQAYPAQLSGGMQQRVGLARVLINQPRVMLMDEPFAALDAQSRVMMQELLLHLWHEVRTTILFVTHDVDEAIFLADRIAIMTARPGRLKQELAVPLPRPRTLEMAIDDTFIRLKREALSSIRAETGYTLEDWKRRLRTSLRHDRVA
jgi:NitT/TauT family transport system ATP-binding protein